MNTKKLFFLIVLLGIFSSLVLGVINGGIFKTNIDDWRDDAWQYNAVAISLLDNHSFHDAGSRFFGPFQKGPGYPIFLALIYSVFGRHPLSAEIMQAILWIGALWLLWDISKRFLSDGAALLPPFFLAGYWGAAAYIFSINSDFLATFFTLLFAWSLLKYQDVQKWIHAGIIGFSLGYLVLIKPIALYLVPCVFLLLCMIFWKPSRRTFIQLASLGILVSSLVGAWSLYNIRLLGTWQLASGGLTLMRRADDVHMSWQRIGIFTVASMFGDIVADKISPGYADSPEPYTLLSGTREKTYYASQLSDKSNEAELQKRQFEEAKFLIQKDPLKFIISALPYVFRLNAPNNHQGIGMIRTFVGDGSGRVPVSSVVVLFGVHVVWFIFLGFVIWGMKILLKDWRKGGMIILITLYFNGMYALVSHAEVRYILPVVPFYFLFSAVALKSAWDKKYSL